jgi:hypothetical protein
MSGGVAAGPRSPGVSMLLASVALGCGAAAGPSAAAPPAAGQRAGDGIAFARLPVVRLAAAPLATAGPIAAAPIAAAPIAAAPLATDPPFATDGPSSDAEDDRAAGAVPSTARLDRLAAVLRREPLAVDPEVDWMFDAAEHRALERALRGARVPVLVAALPMVDEDESGGDSERILRTLQQRVGRKALYVVVDQRGRMDLASVGVPLDLSIPYSLMVPTRDERPYEEQARNPGPRTWESVPGRLRGVLAAVAKAAPGPPNGVVDDPRPLEELDHDHAQDRLREDTIVLTVVGAILGVGAAAVVLVVLRAARRRGDVASAGGSARPARRQPRPARRQPRPARRQPRGGRRRRGRREGGRRA